MSQSSAPQPSTSAERDGSESAATPARRVAGASRRSARRRRGPAASGRLAIGEVVALLRPEFGDLTDSKIRFLEDRRLISPARTESGYRSFGPHDIEVLRWILTKQRDQYLPLSIIGERIDRGEHLADIWGIGAQNATTEPAASGTAPRSIARTPTSASVDTVAVEAESDADDADAPDTDSRISSRDETPDGGSEDSGAAENNRSGPMPSHAVGTPATGLAADAPPWAVVDGNDTRTYSADELSAASGLTVAEVAQLTEFGLLVRLSEQDAAASTLDSGTVVQTEMALEPPQPRYSAAALLVARIAREFSTYGLEARHLRVIRNAAARDATMFEQGIQPVLHAGGSDTDSDAQRSLERLVVLCERLRAQVMTDALGRYWHDR